MQHLNTPKILAALMLIPMLAMSATAVSASERMNVLMLIADDMNSWMLDDADRYSGNVVTPNLRRLAESGVTFSRAYTASPVCSPSRTALFSGMRPWKSGHYHNGLDVRSSEPLKQALSLAGLFKNGGYSTAGYGKVTHGWDLKEYWDEKIGHERDPSPPGAPLTSIGRGEQDWGPIHLNESEMNDTLNADSAIKQLQKNHDRPFFIACGTFNPHMPWYVPQKYFDLYPLDELPTPELLENDLDGVPALGRHLTDGKSKYVDQIIQHGLHKEAVQAYLATTTYADAQLGRVLEALENSPHRDNTIVVFCTDHGFHLGEKNHWQKATLWEEATHCMLMFRVPGLTPSGEVSERFVSLQDIYPTLAELSGLPAPDYVDGRSLKPLLKEPNATWESSAISSLTDKDHPVQGYVSIRSDLGRYIRYGTDQEEFYDTSKDPHEWINQVENPKYTQIIKKLRAALPNASEMFTPLPRERRKSK